MSDIEKLEKAQIAVPQHTSADFEKLKQLVNTISDDEAALLEATLAKKIVKLGDAEVEVQRDDVFMSAYALCFHIVEYLRATGQDNSDVYLPESLVKQWTKTWDAIADRTICVNYKTPLYKVEEPSQ